MTTETSRCSNTVVKKSHCGTKGACGYISVTTIKSVWKMRGVCKKVWESESYVECETGHP